MAMRRSPGKVDERDFLEPKGPPQAGAGPVGSAPMEDPGGSSRGGYSPRENFPQPQPGPQEPSGSPRVSGGVGSLPTPPRPMSPTSMAGSSFSQPGAQPGVLPFKPLPALGGGGGLFGAMGGLKGGGLGVPQSPFSGSQNDPINGLIQQLLAKMGGQQ